MNYKSQVCSLIACIEQNIKNKTDYRDLEKSIGFSYRYIREIFKKTLQVSLSRYILARKIVNAAFEIRHSCEKSITEIAFEYDFSNLDTFARAFKRDTGLTPSEFRKSRHICGRKIICPGVFAPVILDIDNSRLASINFTELMEVNKMCEMKKTSDSCVLYGVPKIYYGRKIDDQTQCTPFPMCLQSVLNYIGQNISYTQIMAASGAAFRLRWDIGGDFAPWAVDITQTYYEPNEPFERAFKAAGRKYTILGEADKKDYFNLIKSELDSGRPVIALGVVGPPEACIVTGYKDNGEKLLGWNLFQESHFGGGVEIDESGYFIKDNWLENTETVMAVAEEASETLPVVEILKNALMLMTQDKVSYVWSDGANNYGGQAAYEAWAKAVLNDAYFADGAEKFEKVYLNAIAEKCYSQGDAEIMVGEGRYYASAYIESLAEQYPTLVKELSECAKLLKCASECALKMTEAWSGTGINEESIAKFGEKETRSKIAVLIRQAAKHEKDACIILKDIIAKI